MRKDDKIVAICSAISVVVTAALTILEMKEAKKLKTNKLPKSSPMPSSRPEGTTGIDTEQFVYDVKFVSIIANEK